MIINILLILLITFGVIALSFIMCFGPWVLLVSRVYCYEAFKYLKHRKEKKLDKISLKQLHEHITKCSFEYDWAKDNPFYQFPIFSHITLVILIIKDIFILIFNIFKWINNYTHIFTYICKLIKYMWLNSCKLVSLILIPFVWIKNEILKKINYLINIKFI